MKALPISVLVICTLLVVTISNYIAKHKYGSSSIKTEFATSKCDHLNFVQPSISTDRINSKALIHNATSNILLIENCTIWDGEVQLRNAKLLSVDGVLKQIGDNLDLSKENTTEIHKINAGGRICSAGIIDMHSHIGTSNWPQMNGHDDVNEMSYHSTPSVRIIDSFSPHDIAIPISHHMGVTTILLLPGSGNEIGGIGSVLKLNTNTRNSVEDMLLFAGVEYEPYNSLNRRFDNKISPSQNGGPVYTYMKHACGENVVDKKTDVQSKDARPQSRMGVANRWRAAYQEAQQLLNKQQEWCSNAVGDFPFDANLEPLIHLLQGKVKLNVHCYETFDIETFMRVASEFDIPIAAFHHAIEAYQIPDLIKEYKSSKQQSPITIATFVDKWGFKQEAYTASLKAGQILTEAGVPVVFKSDHSVSPSQFMAWFAARGYRNGISAKDAFKTVTKNPAVALGLEYRIGELSVGKDADIVIWNKHVYDIGAQPLVVVTNGRVTFEKQTEWPAVQIEMDKIEPTFKYDCKPLISDCILIKQAKKVYSKKNKSFSKVDVLILKGIVDKIQSSIIAPSSCTVINGPEYVVPGFIAASSKLGITEIGQEDFTNDGTVDFEHSPGNSKYGIKLGTLKTKSAITNGITTVEVMNDLAVGKLPPFAYSNVIHHHNDLLRNKDILESNILHTQIGHEEGNTDDPVSYQIDGLMQILKGTLLVNDVDISKTINATILAIHTDSADVMMAIIRAMDDYKVNADIVFVGATEAYLLSKELATRDIPVVLKPGVCTPDNWYKYTNIGQIEGV